MLMLSRICFFMIGTNRLGKVTVGGSQKSYAYNADGTMKTDGLRGLNVTYNYLKLPRIVKKGTTSTINQRRKISSFSIINSIESIRCGRCFNF